MTALGLDTSNYTTSAAIFNGADGINAGRLLEVSPGRLGLRQSEALFQHVKALPGRMAELKAAGVLNDIQAVAASNRPRAVEGSYMPCFLAGEGLGRSLADTLDVPFFAVSHQQGHLAAAAWSAGHMELLDSPFLAWHLSGGTTELLYVEPEGANVRAEKIGGTTDISAGQLIDRTGVRLGLAFPAGKALDALAAGASDGPKPFKVKLSGLGFSLSGVENQVKALAQGGEEPARTARFALDTVCSVVRRATLAAQKAHPGLPVLCSGGVASNSRLRDDLGRNCGVLFAEPRYSTDNAMGVAILARRLLERGAEMAQNVYTVSQVNGRIKALLDADPALGSLFVRGELSNYKTYPSGHHYFSLKDEGGTIRCVMFRREASALRFRPQNGMKVIAFGRVAVFPRDGQYQLYVSALTPDGVGDLYAAFEQLKARLASEGLFDESRKKPIPRFPKRIALVTSPAGAAVRDMIRILGARWPMAEVSVVPCRVQGAEASGEIAGAIEWVNQEGLADLIITGRGGGSMEDLWCFNDERVARAICASAIPVISAVGHEPDVTIADYAADLRAATPSNAAELAVPDQNEQYALLSQLRRRMGQSMESRLRSARASLDRAGRSRMLQSPMSWVDDRRMLLDYQRDKLVHGLALSLGSRREDFARLAASLDALSPLKVLGRGYAIAQGPAGVVRSRKDVRPGDTLTLRVSDGEFGCVVK